MTSSPKGAKSPSTINDIPSQIKHLANTLPDREVFVFFNEHGRISTLTAHDVYVLAGRFAARLRNMGFQQGDMISNALPNSAERIVTDFGIIMAGCIGSNCQVMEKDGSDFEKIANCYKTVGVIVPNNKMNPAYRVLQQYFPSDHQSSASRFDVTITIPEIPSLKRVLFVDRPNEKSSKSKQLSFLDRLQNSLEEVVLSQYDDISPDFIAFVFGTSGTTGFSKLSPRTHATILRTARIYENNAPSVRFGQRPLGWAGGFPFSFLANATTMVIQDCFEGKKELSAKYLWEVLETEGCTSAFMLPQEMDYFLLHFKENSPKFRLKALIVGGQPLRKSVCDALGVLTDNLILTYASTEMSGITNGFLTSPDEMEDFMTGKPLPGVSLKIVDENLHEVDIGKEGTVLIKSPFGSNYYYNQSLKKQTCTEDGYFISGDRGWINEDGVLFVSDRQDDVILHGSVLVYPSWPEAVLARIDGISEVVVMGVPSAESKHGANDRICACVVLQHGSTLDKTSLISSYNQLFVDVGDEFFPRLTYVEFFNEFPIGHTGKVNKRLLREMVMSRFPR